MYGPDVPRSEILSGNIPVPDDARPLVGELQRYSPRTGD
jgi:hypothetical protein